MAVETKTQYKTSDGAYYDDEKKATSVQAGINNRGLIPFRTNTVNNWITQVYQEDEDSGAFKTLVDNKSTDGSTIQTILCDVIIKDLIHFTKIIGSLHGEDEGGEEGPE
jgi:hypothetical protein